MLRLAVTFQKLHKFIFYFQKGSKIKELIELIKKRLEDDVFKGKINSDYTLELYFGPKKLEFDENQLIEEVFKNNSFLEVGLIDNTFKKENQNITKNEIEESTSEDESNVPCTEKRVNSITHQTSVIHLGLDQNTTVQLENTPQNEKLVKGYMSLDFKLRQLQSEYSDLIFNLQSRLNEMKELILFNQPFFNHLNSQISFTSNDDGMELPKSNIEPSLHSSLHALLLGHIQAMKNLLSSSHTIPTSPIITPTLISRSPGSYNRINRTSKSNNELGDEIKEDQTEIEVKKRERRGKKENTESSELDTPKSPPIRQRKKSKAFYEKKDISSTALISTDVPAVIMPVENPLVKNPCDPFRVEQEKSYITQLSQTQYYLEDGHLNTQYYTEMFSKLTHDIYVGESAQLGKVILVTESLRQASDMYKVLIRTKKNDIFISIHCSSKKELFQSIGMANPELGSIKFELKNVLAPKLLEYESKMRNTNYKFGIVYAKDSNQTEQQMFSNVSEDTCPEFEAFLNLLGQKIKLLGFKGFSGGLDVKSDSTGLESVYTQYENQEIMFHVSTMLPFSKADQQQIERKRHIGNDVVVIIFLESGGNFDPNSFVGQFNYVFCVVSPTKIPPPHKDSQEKNFPFYFRISFVTRPGVRSCGPQLPQPAIFPPNERFRNFLLTKLINSERAAMSAPGFASKMERTKGTLLQQLVS